MATESFLEKDFKRRIAKLELIFSNDFMFQLTNIIKKESGIDDNHNGESCHRNEEYYSCIGELYDLLLQYCDKNNITSTSYIHNGEKIPNSIVFFYKQPAKNEIEYYLITFISGQGGIVHCSRITDNCNIPNAIDIEKVLSSQAYQLDELKESLSKLKIHKEFNELLKQCKMAHDSIQSNQKAMFKRLFSGTVFDATIRHKIQFEKLKDIDVEGEAIKWIEKIILPALIEESTKTLFRNSGYVTIYVSLMLDTYELRVCNAEKKNLINFGKARIIQENVYYGKFGDVIMDKAIEILSQMKSKGNLITGRKDFLPHSWVFECPVLFESYK